MILFNHSQVLPLNTPLIWCDRLYYATGYHYDEKNSLVMHISKKREKYQCTKDCSISCECDHWPYNTIYLFENDAELTMYTLGFRHEIT